MATSGTAADPQSVEPERGVVAGRRAGSASATAAGLCGFAIGTETLGSITSPSQRCGATGLRPTFGRVSRAGGMALCWSLDKVGPIAASVEDTALVLAAIDGGDGRDRGSIAAPFHFDAGGRHRRACAWAGCPRPSARARPRSTAPRWTPPRELGIELVRADACPTCPTAR